MNDTTLPRHARTGLLAVGWRKARPGEDGPQPIWPILGGAPEDDAGEQDDDAGDGTEGSDETGDAGEEEEGDSGDGGEEADKPLRAAGTRALESEKARRKAEAERRRTAEARITELEKQLSADKQADAGPDPEQIRREADAAATERANQRILRSEVRAAAAGKLADPRDALRFIDLAKFEVDDDGQVDEDEIADAISDLLKDKPYLAVPTRQRFQGGGDGGARTKSSAPSQVTETELDKMTPDQIDKARQEGRLDDLLGVKR